MERGNPRADDKGVYQAEDPQDKSTDAAMGAERAVVVKKSLERRWSEGPGIIQFPN